MAQVNGRTVPIPETISIEQLKEQLGVNACRMAVEVNGELIDQNRFGEAIINDQCTVEIITLAGGG